MKQSTQTILLDKVSKLFFNKEQGTLKELIPALIQGKQAISSFWALKDLTLSINKGEVLGIVGKNGSGKSTFLKLVAGVTQPTQGKIETKGRMVPLIELGAGFHPELTGRENVFLNGIILGMTRTEIEKKFDNIVEYAGLKDFIDTPVKHYSSGMYLRLAFAIAVHAEPEILLVDEILAVGDMAFQEKCLNSIKSFVKNKQTTIVIVSHSTDLIEQFCTRAIWLNKGICMVDGEPKVVTQKYLESTVSKTSPVLDKAYIDHADPNGGLTLTLSKLTDLKHKVQTVFNEHDILLSLEMLATKSISTYGVNIIIKNSNKERIIDSSSFDFKAKFKALKKGQKTTLFLRIPNVFNSGSYNVSLGIYGSPTQMWEWYPDLHVFRVRREIQTNSLVQVPIAFDQRAV